jgi:hypothetical protein
MSDEAIKAEARAAFAALLVWSGSEAVLEALMELPGLPASVRRAVMKELGRSPQREQRHSEEALSAVLVLMIKMYEEQMRRDGDRPRGGIHRAAVAKVAQLVELPPESLERRLRRHKKAWLPLVSQPDQASLAKAIVRHAERR